MASLFKDHEKQNNNISQEKTEKKIKSYIHINPLSLQLKSIITSLDNKNENYSYPVNINNIHKLKNNKIGIIINRKYLSIYSSNTFKLIYIIDPKKEINKENKKMKNYSLIDFIELKNEDLLLWTSEIIMIYKKNQKIYELLQIINEYEQGTNFIEYTGFEKIEYYKLNSLYELRNRILVSCNSYGLKFYSKQNDKYVLISKEEIEFEVENIFEMKENIFILFQKKSKTYTSKSIPPRSTITNKYRISLYNIKNKEEKILIEDIAYFNSESGIKYHHAFSKINYMFKDKYLFISLPTKIYIYDISQNKQLIEENEITIKFLCNY